MVAPTLVAWTLGLLPTMVVALLPLPLPLPLLLLAAAMGTAAAAAAAAAAKVMVPTLVLQATPPRAAPMSAGVRVLAWMALAQMPKGTPPLARVGVPQHKQKQKHPARRPSLHRSSRWRQVQRDWGLHQAPVQSTRARV